MNDPVQPGAVDFAAAREHDLVARVRRADQVRQDLAANETVKAIVEKARALDEDARDRLAVHFGTDAAEATRAWLDTMIARGIVAFVNEVLAEGEAAAQACNERHYSD